MTLPVFIGLETQPPLVEVSVGDVVDLLGEEGRHAAKVRRLQVGEWLDIVDGCGLRLRGEVTAVASSSLRMRVCERVLEGAPCPKLVLVQALAKGGRDEQAIEAATEIGVDAVVPWQAQRSIVKWVGAKADKARAKWESVVVAAAKQSRRSWLPQVMSVHDSRALAAWVRGVCADGGLVYIAHEAGRATLSADLRDRDWLGGGSASQMPSVIGVIVGPEGGISDEERELFAAAGGVEILLGPHVLRSSSAGCAALTLVSAATGRW